MNTRNFVRFGLVNVLLVGLVLALAGCPGPGPEKPGTGGDTTASPTPGASPSGGSNTGLTGNVGN